MKKNSFLLLTAFLITKWASTQSLQPTVLAASAAISKSENVTLEWTLGELAIATNYLDENIITEGFHQPILKIDRLEPIDGLADNLLSENPYQITVSPNPTAAMVTIQIDTKQIERLEFMLLDSWGQAHKVPTKKLPSQTFEMVVENLPNGIYFLLFQDDKGYREVFKISKIE